MSTENGIKRKADWRPLESWKPVESGEVSETADIAAIYDEQREKCPVAWCDPGHGDGYWTLFRHDDIARVLQDPKRFSSAVPKFGPTLIPIELDPPEHTQYRALLSRLINPAKMRVFEESIRSFVTSHLDEALKDDEPDLLTVAKTIPLHAFCLLVGLPEEGEWKNIKAMADSFHGAGIPSFSSDPDAVERRKEVTAPLVDYVKRQIALRRENPGDDLVSDILAGNVRGRPITDGEALQMLSLVFLAGHRTTGASIAGVTVELIKRPDIVKQLQDDPGKIPAAVEEMLRLETVLHTMPRYCTEDTEIGGRMIRAGEEVFPVFASANFDPEAFENPTELDIERRPNHHLSFGRGIHTCAGAPLARLQIRIFVEELLNRVSSMELTGTVVRDVWPRFGPKTIPVKIELAD